MNISGQQVPFKMQSERAIVSHSGSSNFMQTTTDHQDAPKTRYLATPARITRAHHNGFGECGCSFDACRCGCGFDALSCGPADSLRAAAADSVRAAVDSMRADVVSVRAATDSVRVAVDLVLWAVIRCVQLWIRCVQLWIRCT